MHWLTFMMIGSVAGLLAGLLGLGGGIIIVPALLATFTTFAIVPTNILIPMAVGTSLATIVVTLLASLQAHVRRGAVRWDLVKQLLPGLLFGVIFGVLLARVLPALWLRMGFSVFLLFVAYKLLRQSASVTPIARQSSKPVFFVMTSLIGLLAGVLGMGGGVLLTPFLLRLQINLREATGTTVACGVFMAIFATLLFVNSGHGALPLTPWSTGFVYWPAFLGIASTSVFCAPLGAALAYRLPTAVLKRIFALFLLLVAADMAAPIVMGLL